MRLSFSHKGFGAALMILLAADIAPSNAQDAEDSENEDTEDLAADELNEETQPQDLTSLPSITIEGADVSSVYSTPGPVSSISGSELNLNKGGDINRALRSTPGVFTLNPTDQPGIAPNIRGMEGYGRVNTMIDGVPQTFRNVAGHASSGGTLTYVDPSLLSGIDVERGAVSGAHGTGTLSGAVNMRTMGLEDVLLPGENWGGLSRLTAGTNGRKYSTMFAGGVRSDVLDDGMVGLMGAFTRSDINRYENGDGVEVDSFNPENNPKSGLAKLTFEPTEDQRIQFGGRWYRNTFDNSNYEWQIKNDTYTLDYSLNPVNNNLVNLDFNAFFNQTKLSYPQDTGGSYQGRETDNTGYGANISNTSRFNLERDINLSLYYGLSWQKDEYDVNEYRGGNSPGELIKSSAFADATLNWDIFTLTGGLRYDHWALEGYQAPINPGIGDCPSGGSPCGDQDVDRSGGRWNPKITAAAQPLDWLQLYATYAHTYRPPTVPEMLYSLAPFGAGVGTGAANNLDLQPEISRGWDIGANFNTSNLFLDDDDLKLKVGYFDNDIENFIVNDFVNVPGRGITAMWVNRPGTTRMHGIEIEGRYDAGFFYAHGSYTHSDTQQPIGQGAGWGNGLYGETPEKYATLDVGTRWFDERLTLGGVVRYVGESVQANGDLFGAGPDFKEVPSYTLFDAYASFKYNENASVFASVENLTDKRYHRAGSYEADLAGGDMATGRGRTVIVGATLRF